MYFFFLNSLRLYPLFTKWDVIDTFNKLLQALLKEKSFNRSHPITSSCAFTCSHCFCCFQAGPHNVTRFCLLMCIIASVIMCIFLVASTHTEALQLLCGKQEIIYEFIAQLIQSCSLMFNFFYPGCNWKFVRSATGSHHEAEYGVCTTSGFSTLLRAAWSKLQTLFRYLYWNRLILIFVKHNYQNTITLRCVSQSIQTIW